MKITFVSLGLWVCCLLLAPSLMAEKSTEESIDKMNWETVQLYQQGKYQEAGTLAEKAYQLSKSQLGEKHPITLSSLNNLAFLHQSQGRNGEAEPLYQKALQLRKEVLGEKHPDTLISLNNLAKLYRQWGDQQEKAITYFESIQSWGSEVLGSDNPRFISFTLNYASFLTLLGKESEGLRLLAKAEAGLFERVKRELTTVEAQRQQRIFLQTLAVFQDLVFSYALDFTKPKYQNYAADVLIRWKQVQAEEEMAQLKFLHQSRDPEILAIKKELIQFQSKVTHAIGEKGADVSVFERQMQTQRKKLRSLVANFYPRLQTEMLTMEYLLRGLGKNEGLVEFRIFNPFNHKTKIFGAPHLLALFARPNHPLQFKDLGEVEALLKGWQKSVAEPNQKGFYHTLLGAFDNQLHALERVYLAPDSFLNLVPFHRLILPDGRYWAERQELVLLSTGRDLQHQASRVSVKGLVALGGIDYDHVASSQKQAAPEQAPLGSHRAVEELREGVKPLPYSLEEARQIASYYNNIFGPDQATFWQGKEASESALKSLPQPPAVLHLSTHGFYLSDTQIETHREEHPLAFSGLALAGANQGFAGKWNADGEDGVLYAMEVLGLNLQGTRLVSLSACKTGQGVMDYSEGVYGLVRAFRGAGAQAVLMTLRSVGDQEAKEFMTHFYKTWLAMPPGTSPAKALHQTRLDFIHHTNPKFQNPQFWEPYVMVGE